MLQSEYEKMYSDVTLENFKEKLVKLPYGTVIPERYRTFEFNKVTYYDIDVCGQTIRYGARPYTNTLYTVDEFDNLLRPSVFRKP